MVGHEGHKEMALEGVRVLDIASVLASPFAAALLGDYGAEVIKVELPGTGDTMRNLGPFDRGVSLWFNSVGRNKKSITLDMRKPQGKELLKRLVATSDVLCENFRPGTLEEWGLGYDTLSEVNPRLVMLRVSGYGQTGPHAAKAGFGMSAGAFAGLTYITGSPDRPPESPPFSLSDYVAGMFGAIGVLTALYYRDGRRRERGQYIDVGLYEAVFRLLEHLPGEYAKLGVVRERRGNRLGLAVPVGVYRTGDDKWVAMTCSTDRVFARLVAAMGQPELAQDQRFDTNPHRVANQDECEGMVAAWIGERSAREVCRILDEAGVPVGPVNSIADIMEDPQFKARENVVTVKHPLIGDVPVPNVVPKFSLTPGQVRSASPLLGQHNEEVYSGLLGLSADELESLKAAAVI